MVGVKGQDQGWAISQIHLIDYNFASNCHRDFKLGSYFSLWNAAPNMTLTLTLKSSTKVKVFETYQIRKTSQNMLGYYAQGIIYCWDVKGQGQGQAKGQIHLISYNFASNCHRDFKGRVVKKIDVFKELAPRLRTYELRSQGKKYRKEIISTNPRQTNTSRCPKKATPENDHQSLKLGLYFNLWKGASNMTLTFTFDLDLEKFK